MNKCWKSSDVVAVLVFKSRKTTVPAQCAASASP